MNQKETNIRPLSVSPLNSAGPQPYRAAQAIQPPRAAVRPQIRAAVRQGIIFYFLLVILEGVFRKWIVPDLNQLVYIAKDAVLAYLCVRVALALNHIPPPRSLRHSNVGQLFVAFAIYSLCEGFNPLLPNAALGIWGIRTYVLPMSLVYLIPIGFTDPMRSERLFRNYLLLVIPIALLCFMQYRLPPGHFLNKYSNNELGQNVATVGDLVRVSGPFSYISGLATYLAFASAGLLGVLFSAQWKLKNNRLTWIGLLLTVGVIPMSGSRSIVLYFVLYILILIALSPLLKRGAAAPSRMLVAGICVASLSIGLFGEAFDRLADRARTSGDTRSRLDRLVFQPFVFLDMAGFCGYGAAATHQAAPVLVPRGQSYYWLPTRNYEEESGRVMLEMGGLGFLLYIALKIGVCAMTFQYIRQFGNSVPLAIPVACLLTAASCMITGMLFSSVGSSLYWGIFGLFVAQADATVVRPSCKR